MAPPPALLAKLLKDELSQQLCEELSRDVDGVLQELRLVQQQQASLGIKKLAEEHKWQRRHNDATLAALPYRAIQKAATAGQSRQMSLHDPLTLLKGKAYLGCLLDALTSAEAEAEGWSMAVVSADLDNFGLINDKWSHADGDAAMIRTCRAVSDYSRRWNSRFPHRAFHAVPMRVGGDEIVIAILARRDYLESLLAECRILLSGIRGAVCDVLKEMFPFSSLTPGDKVDKRSGICISAEGPSISMCMSTAITAGPGQLVALYEAYKVRATRLRHAWKPQWKADESNTRGGGIKCEDEDLRDRAAKVRRQVQALIQGNSENRERAAVSLATSAGKGPENCVAVAMAGAVEPLVDLISRGGSVGGQEQAVRALAQLCHEAQNQSTIVAAGAIQPLIKLLRIGSANAREWVALALSCLARRAENRDAIVAEGALPALVELLASGSNLGKERAAAVLVSLTSSSSETRLAAAEAGAIGPLVQLLTNGSVTGRGDAAWALAHLSLCAGNQTAVAAEGQAIPALVQLLESGCAFGKEQAAWALGNLVLGHKENQRAAVAANAIAPLVEMVDSGSAVGRERAALALGNLARNGDAAASIVSQGACGPLVSLLHSGHAEARRRAARALVQLTRTGAGRDAANAAGAHAAAEKLLVATGDVDLRGRMRGLLDNFAAA